MIRLMTILLVASSFAATPLMAKPLNSQCGRLYDKVLDKTNAFEREHGVVIDTTDEGIRTKTKPNAGSLDPFKRAGDDLVAAMSDLVSFGKGVNFGGDDWSRTPSFGGDDWQIAMPKLHDDLKAAMKNIQYGPVSELRMFDKPKSIIADIRRVSRGNCR